MTTTPVRRQPKGHSDGGQFAAGEHAEPEVHLTEQWCTPEDDARREVDELVRKRIPGAVEWRIGTESFDDGYDWSTDIEVTRQDGTITHVDAGSTPAHDALVEYRDDEGDELHPWDVMTGSLEPVPATDPSPAADSGRAGSHASVRSNQTTPHTD